MINDCSESDNNKRSKMKMTNETRVEPISGFIPKERPAAKAEMKMEPLSGYKPVRPKVNSMER